MGDFTGSGPQSTTQKTIQKLTPEQQQLIDIVTPIAAEYAQNPPQQFPGQETAGFTPAQLQAQQTALQAAAPGGSLGQLIQGANATQGFLQGPVLFNNPALEGAISAAIRPVEQAFTTSILPNIRNNAVQAGQFGGSRQGVAEGLAANAFLQQSGDIASKLTNEGYKANLSALIQGQSNLPNVLQANLLPSLVQSGVGSQQQALEQALLSEQVRKFIGEQVIPFQSAQQVANLAFGLPGGETVTRANTSGSPGFLPNPSQPWTAYSNILPF